jgi:hypothetical protein
LTRRKYRILADNKDDDNDKNNAIDSHIITVNSTNNNPILTAAAAATTTSRGNGTGITGNGKINGVDTAISGMKTERMPVAITGSGMTAERRGSWMAAISGVITDSVIGNGAPTATGSSATAGTMGGNIGGGDGGSSGGTTGIVGQRRGSATQRLLEVFRGEHAGAGINSSSNNNPYTVIDTSVHGIHGYHDNDNDNDGNDNGNK